MSSTTGTSAQPIGRRLGATGTEIGVAVAATGVIALILAAQGGYFPVAWGWGALVLFWAAGLVLVVADRVELSRPEVWLLGLLAGLVGWVALSLVWTASTPQTVDELERVLVYLAGATAFCLAARRETAVVLLGAVLAAAVGICLYALATRLFPSELSADVFGGYRLSTPVGYWNGLGLLAAIGVLLAFGTVASRQSSAFRTAAAASLPLLLCTLYFTFSRGAWVALAAGLAFAIAVDSHRLRLITVAGVLAPAPALAVLLASRADALTHTGSTLADASQEGHRLAVWLVVLSLVAAFAGAAVVLGERRVTLSARARRVYAASLVGIALAAVVAGIAAGGGPADIVRNAYDRFTASPTATSGDLNKRLFDLSSNGRTELWSAAWHQFKSHPLGGAGGGTFEAYWNEHRTSSQTVKDAHNLYVEKLGELGVPGLVLLAGVLVLPFAGLRARRRPLVPIALAAYTALLVHAAYDWDWELPGVFLAGLLCGLAALVAARDEARTISVARRGRVLVLGAIGVCAAFVLVALIGNISASRAQSALDDRRYAKAAGNARRAADWAPWSGRAWFLLGTAEARLGHEAESVASLRTAIRNDPTNYRYWLALAAVAQGNERVHALREVFRLNPRFRP